MSTVLPFNDIARNLDPAMPQEHYDDLRDKYFRDVVAPSLNPQEMLTGRELFMKQTERPQILSAGDKVLLEAGVVMASGAESMTGPLRLFGSKLPDENAQALKVMEEIAARDGVPTTAARVAGSLVGAAPTLAAGGEGAGAIATQLTERFMQGAKYAEVASRALRGGLGFGAYEFASDQDGERMLAGLKGFGVGASLDVLFGSIADKLLANKLAPDSNVAEKFVRDAMQGKPVPPEVDKVISQSITEGQKLARVNMRPKEFRAGEDVRSGDGVLAAGMDAQGGSWTIPVRNAQEGKALEQIEAIVQQGGSLDLIKFHPDYETRARRFMDMLDRRQQVKYEGKIINADDATKVAEGMRAEGIPAVAVAEGKVRVDPIPAESVEAKDPGVAMPGRPTVDEKGSNPLGEPPTATEVEVKLDQIRNPDTGAALTASEREFMRRQLDWVWNPKVPEGQKGAAIAITRQHMNEFVPDAWRLQERTLKDVGMTNEHFDAMLKDFNITKGSEQEQIFREAILNEMSEEQISHLQEVAANSRHVDVNEASVTEEALRKGEIEPRAKVKLSELEEIPELPEVGPQKIRMPDTEIEGIPTVPAGSILFHREVPMNAVRDIVDSLGDKYRSIVIPGEAGNATIIAWEPQFGNKISDMGGFLAKTPLSNLVEFTHQLKVQLAPGAEITLQRRPHRLGGVIPAELAEQLGGPGSLGVMHPNWKEALSALGIEVPPETQMGDLPLVGITTGVSNVRDSVYHELLHAHLVSLEGLDTAFKNIGEDVRKTAVQIADGLQKGLPVYRGKAIPQLVDEAYTYAATAVRMGDHANLDVLARLDTDLEHVINFVNDTSLNLLEKVQGKLDSAGMRIFQRKLDDLIKRTGSDKAWEWKNVENEIGTQPFYDAEAREYKLKQKDGTEQVFKDEKAMWDFVDNNRGMWSVPSFSSAAEIKGLRGPIVPRGGEPGSRSTLPDTPPDPRWKWLGWQALMGTVRPHLNWVATIDKKLNDAWGVRGRHMPLFDTVKAVDDKVRSLDHDVTEAHKAVVDFLGGVPYKKQYDMFDYLATQPKARDYYAKKVGLDEDLQRRALGMYEYLKEFAGKRGISISPYVTDFYPTLRNFGFIEDHVWGAQVSSNPSFWEKAIRVDRSFDPRDNHLGRFTHFVMREAVLNDMSDELGALRRLVDLQTKDGNYVLGPLRWPLNNYMNYIKGIPDVSGQMLNWAGKNFEDAMRGKLVKMNEHLPSENRINVDQFKLPGNMLNRALVLSYAAGLGARPAILIRDATQLFLTWMPIAGPGRFIKGFMQHGFSSDSYKVASDAKVLLERTNIGEAYGDIFKEIPTEGRNVLDRLNRVSNQLLAPARWGNNWARNVVYNTEYNDALDAIKQYRAGNIALDKLQSDTILWYTERPQGARLLNLVHTASPEEAADQFAKEAIDLTQWPLRRGTQPAVLRTGFGRVFGQYGTWPANYTDFFFRMMKKLPEYPGQASKALATFAAVNWAAVETFNALGIESEHWFGTSPMSYVGGPHLEFMQNLMQSVEESDKGRAARKNVAEYPLNFIPGSVEFRQILKAVEQGHLSLDKIDEPGFWRVMGFRPVADKDEGTAEYERFLNRVEKGQEFGY